MLLFLNTIYAALDHDSHSKMIAFYADFSKAFDKVPFYDLIRILIDLGVGGCLVETYKIDDNKSVRTIQGRRYSI